MSGLGSRGRAKQVLGALPWTAELYQRAVGAQDVPAGGYSLERLTRALPGWAEAARAARASGFGIPRRRLLVLGYLKWWLEFSTALGTWLAALGCDVDLGYLPHRRWVDLVPRFDLRRQAAAIRRALDPLAEVIRPVNLAHAPAQPIPDDLAESLEELSRIDVQYTLQREDLDSDAAPLMDIRRRRNRSAAERFLGWVGRHRYDAVLIPNGSILEFGSLYRAARSRNLPVVTFEFGEQRQRIWLASDAEVMRHDTSDLWRRWEDHRLTPAERSRLQELMQARRGGRTWSNFGRAWQTGRSEGAQAAARALAIAPDAAVVLLCTNVVGDSLTLGRQVFTEGMADWLSLTVRHLAPRREVQLIVRVHPGELLGAGHPSQEIVQAALPRLAPQVRVVPPDSRLNTYDLMELADAGLVYTTTAGLEMAMGGVPVIVAGQTHYRGRGFTLDPGSRPEYLETIDRLLERPAALRLDPERIELAWRYAYQFFFEFPRPFPWHLLHFWDDMAERPLESLLSESGTEPYLDTLRRLSGQPGASKENAGRSEAESVVHGR